MRNRQLLSSSTTFGWPRSVPEMEDVSMVGHALSTDVVTSKPAPFSAGGVVGQPLLGAKIANALGIPSTLGCIARTLHDKRTVLLSNWHILFGNGSDEGSVVWLVDEARGTRHYTDIGRTLYGTLGNVHFAGQDYYVDCAISTYLHPLAPSWSGTQEPAINGHATAQLGDLVIKTEAATGTTAGIVVNTDYADVACIAGRSYSTPRQLLVRSVQHDAAFAAKGDSGAVLVNTAGNVVGLLWGTNSRGEGIACPIGAVLYAMNIALELSPHEADRTNFTDNRIWPD